MMLSRGNFLEFFTRPISGTCIAIAIAIAICLVPTVMRLLKKKKSAKAQ